MKSLGTTIKWLLVFASVDIVISLTSIIPLHTTSFSCIIRNKIYTSPIQSVNGKQYRFDDATSASATPLYAVKKSKKQTVAAGLKGFGAVVGASVTNDPKSSSLKIDIDRSKPTLTFYENMIQSNPIAGDNLKRTALAYTYNGTSVDYKLRGVVTTREISKGSDVITIPYEMAIDLGPEGSDPTIPGVEFLKDYCLVMNENDPINDMRRLPYYRMLPTFDSIDCRGCTNFFSDVALNALQSPYIVKETNKRRIQIEQRFDYEMSKLQDSENNNEWMWIDGVTPISIDHLIWATWIVTSRVLTVQTSSNTNGDESMPVQYRRLLIPYLDMCNHARTSNHLLTGRATNGGLLRIVAGTTIPPGKPIEICYGGGMSGNDRFLQEYGFLDTNEDAYTIVAMDLLGQKRRSSSNDNSYLSLQDRTDCLNALNATTIEDDEAVLIDMVTNTDTDRNLLVAIQYRIGVKKALQKLRIAR